MSPKGTERSVFVAGTYGTTGPRVQRNVLNVIHPFGMCLPSHQNVKDAVMSGEEGRIPIKLRYVLPVNPRNGWNPPIYGHATYAVRHISPDRER